MSVFKYALASAILFAGLTFLALSSLLGAFEIGTGL